jgi:hypothetical protein
LHPDQPPAGFPDSRGAEEKVGQENLRGGQFFVDRNPHSGKINLNFSGREKSDEGPQTGRKKKVGQEA